MKNWLSKFLAPMTPQGRSAFRLLSIFLGAVFVVGGYLVYQLIHAPSWQLWYEMVGVGVLLVFALTAEAFALRNRHELAIWMVFVPWLVVLVLTSALISGLGFALLFSAVTIIMLVAGQTLPPRQATALILSSIGFGFLALLIDLFSPADRIVIAGFQTVVYILLAILLPVFGFTIVRSYRDYSLRTKLIISSLVVTLIPLGATFLINNRNMRQNLTNDANAALTTVAATARDHVDDFISQGLTSIRSAAQSHILAEYLLLAPNERPGSETEIVLYQDLRAIAKRDSIYITSVGLIDAQGKDVADTDLTGIGLEKTGRSWFTEPIKSGLPYTSPLEFSQTEGQYSIYFAAPVYDNNGKIIGVLRLRYNADILQRIVADSASASKIPDSFLVLVDENHIRVAHSSDPSLILKSVVPLSAAKLSQLQESRRLPLNIQANEISTNIPAFEQAINNYSQQSIFSADFASSGKGLDQAAIVRLKYQPWFMIVAQPINTFLAPAEAQTRTDALLALLIVAVVAAAGFFVAQTLSAPIVRLTTVAEQVSAGNLSVQAKVESQDEIGTLATTFNAMTKQLGDLIGTLEQRVADRTKALQTSTEVSRRLSTILEQKLLVTEVVEQVKNAFNYYHAHIYFFDQAQAELVMAGGTGEAGAIMLASGHTIPKGRGLVGHAAESNQPVLVTDTTQDPNWLPNPLLPETKSELAIPISIGDQVLGVLDVQNNIVGSLKREDVDVLQSIANQVAIAMQNIRQYEGAQKIATDLGVVASVGIATSTITEADRLLQEVVDLSKQSFKLYHAHIYLLNEAGDTLELAAGAGEAGRQMVKEGRSIALNSEKSLVARAARTHEGVVVNDVSTDPDFLPNPLLPETRSEMAVPMIVGTKVIGVLDVQSDLINRFTEIDVNIKTTLAAQVAIAVENARSFLQAQRKAEFETTVNLIGQRIQGTTTIEAALQVAARELGHTFGRKPTVVSLNTQRTSGQRKGNS